MANTSQTMAVDKPILSFRASSHALAVTSLWGRSVESIVMFILYSIRTRKYTFAPVTNLQIPRFPFSTMCACSAAGMAQIDSCRRASEDRRRNNRPLPANDLRLTLLQQEATIPNSLLRRDNLFRFSFKLSTERVDLVVQSADIIPLEVVRTI